MRFAAIVVLLLTGCTVTDDQWDAFCPDGHCPISKLGKAANEEQREKDFREGRMPPMPVLPPLKPIGEP